MAKRFVVAFEDDFEGSIDMKIVEAESAFWACVAYLELNGGESCDPDVLASCNESITTLNYECVVDAVINAIEIP